MGGHLLSLWGHFWKIGPCHRLDTIQLHLHAKIHKNRPKGFREKQPDRRTHGRTDARTDRGQIIDLFLYQKIGQKNIFVILVGHNGTLSAYFGAKKGYFGANFYKNQSFLLFQELFYQHQGFKTSSMFKEIPFYFFIYLFRKIPPQDPQNTFLLKFYK